MAERTIKTREGPINRRKLVVEGRRLVLSDLGYPPDHQASDMDLARRHQEKFLGAPLKCQPDTWLKTVAVRAHNGWNVSHERRISADARERRLAIARGGHHVTARPSPLREPTKTGPTTGGGGRLSTDGVRDDAQGKSSGDSGRIEPKPDAPTEPTRRSSTARVQ